METGWKRTEPVWPTGQATYPIGTQHLGHSIGAPQARPADRVELVAATPLPGAFTTLIASARLRSLLDDRTIVVETDFHVGWIDPETRTLVPNDEREIPFDVRNLLEAGRAAPEVLQLPPDERVRGLERDGRHDVDLLRPTNCYRGVTWGDRSS